MQHVAEWNTFMTETSSLLDSFDNPRVVQVSITMRQYTVIQSMMNVSCLYWQGDKVRLVVVELEAMSMLKIFLCSEEYHCSIDLETLKMIFDRHCGEVKYDRFSFLWWMGLKLKTELGGLNEMKLKHKIVVLKLASTEGVKTATEKLAVVLEKNG